MTDGAFVLPEVMAHDRCVGHAQPVDPGLVRDGAHTRRA
jgi:hypothetical protein